jgi:hypothetical protein
MDYGWFVAAEHLNRPLEILGECEQHFRIARRRYFPLVLPSTQLNLVVGLQFAMP